MNSVIYATPTLPVGVDGNSRRVKVTGHIAYEHWRGDRMLSKGESDNGLTNVGMNMMLGVTFHADTQLTAWYILLLSNASYSALSATDTMASHSGWTECISYSETTRQQWTCGAASGQSITDGTAATFTINADSTVVKGIGVVSDNTKSGTSGTLWSTGLFGSDQTLMSGDQLKITYTVNIS